MNKYLKQPLVFVVDDEAPIRKALTQSLIYIECKVESFESAEAALAVLKDHKCDLLITDVNMPGLNGLELLLEIRKLWPLLPVIVMSGYGDIPMAVKAVKKGAFDFIEKPLDEDTLVPLIKSALKQHYSEDPATKKPLTKTEKQILALIAAGKTNKEIAFELERSIRTIENHRHRMMKKLGVESSAELVKSAINLGLTS